MTALKVFLWDNLLTGLCVAVWWALAVLTYQMAAAHDWLILSLCVLSFLTLTVLGLRAVGSSSAPLWVPITGADMSSSDDDMTGGGS